MTWTRYFGWLCSSWPLVYCAQPQNRVMWLLFCFCFISEDLRWWDF